MDIPTEIKKIADTFGMGNRKLAEITNTSYGVVKLNNSPKAIRNNWTKQDLEKLINYIKEEAKKLKC
tara:strand:+ start:588 stop:788 length:201 start_codon:yes stop_codon:yes gene_type:complete